MNNVLKKIINAGLFLSIAFMFSQYASAAGGGSGGGFPSESIPRFDPVEKYQEGIAHLKSGDYKKAQKAFKKVLSVANKDANTNYYLGIAYYVDDKAKKARKPFQRAIKYNPNNILAIGYLGAVYTLINKPEKASEQKSKLDALKAACDSCAKLKDINGALDLLNSVQENSKVSLLPEINTLNTGDEAYVVAVEHINQGNYEIALESLNKSAYSFGPHPDILTYQGFVNRKLGHYDLALNYYEQALSVDDGHRGANEYLGEYYVEVGDLASANKQLAKLEEICSFGCEEAEELRRWIFTKN